MLVNALAIIAPGAAQVIEHAMALLVGKCSRQQWTMAIENPVQRAEKCSNFDGEAEFDIR